MRRSSSPSQGEGNTTTDLGFDATRANEWLNMPKVIEQPTIFYEYVIIFQNTSCMSDHDEAEKLKDVRIDILKRIRSSGLQFQQIISRDGDEIFVRIGCDEGRLMKEAERMKLRVPLRPKEGVMATGAAPFENEKKGKFMSDNENDPSMPFFSSAKRQEIILSILTTKQANGQIPFDYVRQIRIGNAVDFFPLHERPYLEKLATEWGSLSLVRNFRESLEQPLDDVRKYYGEYIGMYFAWLGFYTKALVPLSFLSIIVLIVQIADDVDNNLVPFYCFFICVWSTCFLELWKRKQATLAWDWSTFGYVEEEKIRPNFRGIERINKVTGEVEIHYSTFKRAAKVLVGLPVLIVLLVSIVVGTIALLSLRITMSEIEGMRTYGPIIAGVLNAIIILILDEVIQKVTYELTEWENYKTEAQFESNLVFKTFILQFINSFISLFYIAFVKDSEPEIFGNQDKCEGSCMRELMIQLGSIMVTRMLLQQFMEYYMPYIRMKMRLAIEKAQTDETVADSRITPEEYQSKQEVYESAHGDYNEMIIQFGYVTLFAAAFPLTSLLALINNIIEIRVDAQKLCVSHRRPFYRSASDIGVYYRTLEVMSMFSVITNCGILVFTSDVLEDQGFVDDTDTTKKLWIGFLAENLIFLCKYIVSIAIVDVPQEVQDCMESAKHYQGEVMKSRSEAEENSKREKEYEEFVSKMTPSKLAAHHVDRSKWLFEKPR